ncbi:hypothetical protein, partial [Phocoenobacter skyensis]
VDSSTTREFDDKGNATKESFDKNNDGIVDAINTNTYDDKGNQTKTEYDKNADGTVDSSKTREFDDKGNATKVSVDKNNDGTVDAINTNTYDDKGNQTKTEYDKNANGTVDSSTTREFDDKGQVAKELLDKNNNGTTDAINTNTYDDKGNQIKTEYDKNADGTVDSSTTREFDDKGNATKESFDKNNDGIVDAINTNTYDDKEQKVKTEYDKTADGSPDKIETYEYNDMGRIVKVIEDRNADGVLEEGVDQYKTWQLNDKGYNEKTVVYEPSGEAKVSWTYTLDDFNSPLRVDTDNGNDGTIDGIKTFEYNDQHELIKLYVDNDNDGIMDKVLEFTDPNVTSYASYGRSVFKVIHDTNDDGKIDKISEYDIDGLHKNTLFKEDGVTVKATVEFENDSHGRVIKEIIDSNADDVTDRINTIIYDDKGKKEFLFRDDVADGFDGNADQVYAYKDATLTSDHSEGMQKLWLANSDVDVTISDEVLAQVANAENGNKVVVHHFKNATDTKLILDGDNFVKTAGTETIYGQDYVKYTDGADHTLVVDPDVTVTII